MNDFYNALVTTGDRDGVGLEITKKSLAALGPQANVRFVVFYSSKDRQSIKNIDGFKTIEIQSLQELSQESFNDFQSIYLIGSEEAPSHWVEDAATYCYENSNSCLITAPMSKGHENKVTGHTEILQRVTGEEDIFMGFIGREFHVVLATGHLPLKDVPAALTDRRVEQATRAAMCLAHLTGSSSLAVLGLNPHAGEAGLISDQDLKIMALAKKVAGKFPLEGPIVPDAAFTPMIRKRHRCFLALYHDQGLIPFKCVHGISEGIQLSLGIPFIRTSVDHGTAKDLYGKDIADFSSMRMALEWAVRLVKEGKTARF